MKQYKFIFVCLTILHRVDNSQKLNTETQLIHSLLGKHPVDARPVVNTSSAIEVKFGVELVQLIAVDERSQFITTKLWVRQIWINELIKWDTAEWEGVDQLTVEPRDIWKPDIILYNNAADSPAGGVEKYNTLVTIYPNGVNSWLAPAIFKSTCKINVKHFPFDTQTCTFKFGSWAFDARKVSLLEHGAPLITQQYLNSSTWDIVGAKTEFHSVVYGCCPDPYEDLTFTFVIRRSPLYYVFNVIAPCIVLVLMVLFSFLLPPESGERLSLNITVMLALAVFLQFIGDLLPRNSDSTPILSIFFITLMSESAFALITTILVLSVHHKGEEKGAQPPPRWARKLFLEIISRDIGYTAATTRVRNAINAHHYGTNGDTLQRSMTLMKILEENRRKCPTKHEYIVVYTLQDILKEVNKITTAIQDQDRQDEIDAEWKMLGKVLDRVFFFLFLMVFFVSAMGTLLEVYRHDAITFQGGT